MTTHRIFRGGRAAALVLALAGLLLCLTGTSAQAEGKLNVVKHFDCAEGALDVITYTQDGLKLGLLGFIVGDKRVSFAGDATSWPDLINLIVRAANGQSGGSLTEVEGSNKCTITIASGQPLHITLKDPRSEPVEITVAAESVDALLEALEDVQAYLKK